MEGIPTPKVMSHLTQRVESAIGKEPALTPKVERRLEHGPYGLVTGCITDLELGEHRVAVGCAWCGGQTYCSASIGHPRYVLDQLEDIPCFFCGRYCSKTDPARKLTRAQKAAEKKLVSAHLNNLKEA